METSNKIEQYFKNIEDNINEIYNLAIEARKKGFDPTDTVEIPLARNMAERVEGLISAVAPHIKNKGIPERIIELEEKYGKLDWRVALTIALDVARENFCKFKDKIESMEMGIRTGFAYLTLGVVASPLEGFIKIKEKSRKDGKIYLSLFYSHF